MKVSLVTMGTRGDIQPFIALGEGLLNRGYEVVICTSRDYEDFVSDHGLSFIPIRADFLTLTQSEEGKRMLGGNPFEIMKQMKSLIHPMMIQMLEDIQMATEDADTLIYHPKAFGGYDIAEKRKIPAFVAHPVPIIKPTGAFTNPALPFSLSNPWLNKKSYHINRLMIFSFMKLINKWRRTHLHLPDRSILTDDLRIDGREISVLYGCSPSVIPYDVNWKNSVCMEGFWFLSEKADWQPPHQLESFLCAGAPPIVVSFSSMPLKQPAMVLEMIRQALKRSGQRGILLTGSSGMSNYYDPSDDNVLCIPEAPHSWLFPRAAGVIHHGGAGTTAAVLKAGKPMTICPFATDQPFWARRMSELGVSTSPLIEKMMSIDTFTKRIAELTSSSMIRYNAKEIAVKLNAEQGVERTVDFIGRKLGFSL